jgi:hypothetical protein
MFSLQSWWVVRKAGIQSVISAKEHDHTKKTESQKKIDGQKRRLFLIASQTCVCLLLNVGVTISTSGALEEWSRTSDIWLTCSTLETEMAKNYNSYEVWIFHIYEMAPLDI